MIEIDESKYGTWPNGIEGNWLLTDEWFRGVLEQLYAQMMGWT